MKNPLFFTLLIVLYPLIWLYSANLHQVLFTDIIIPLIILLPLAFSGFYLINIKLKNKLLSGIITSTSSLTFFSYGPISKIIKSVPVLNRFISGQILAFLIVAFFIGFVFWILKNRRYLPQFSRILKLLSVFLMIIPINSILLNYIFNVKQPDIKRKNNILTVKSGLNKENFPDIYYIILDRYAGKDTLNNVYGYDNSPFLNDLKSTGFHVGEFSWANYHSSAHSIASSLNMSYLDEIMPKSDIHNKDWKAIYGLIKNYQVSLNLKKIGYKYYHFGSWWWPTTKNNEADKNINLGLISEFSSVLLSNSLIDPFARAMKLPFFDSRYSQWRRINYQLDLLPKVAEDKNTTFVFAHLIIPHEPYVFQSSGQFLDFEEDKNKPDKIKYLDQVKFLNSRLKIFVDKVLSANGNSVIIFQADEGPYPEIYDKNKNNFDWAQADKSDINHKMSIFNTVYFPDKNYDSFIKASSPVNVFRIIFNKYFASEIQLLPDRYFVGNMAYPYNLIEITK